MRQAMRRGAMPKGDPERMLDVALDLGVITADEVLLVRDAEAARREAAQVDSFPADELVAPAAGKAAR